MSKAERPSSSLRVQPKVALGLRIPLGHHALLVNRHECVLGGVEDRPTLSREAARGHHQRLDRDARGPGDHSHDPGADDLIAVVDRRPDQQRRQRQHRHHRRDPGEQLHARPVECEPGDRHDHERLEDDGVLAARVAQQRDHREARPAPAGSGSIGGSDPRAAAEPCRLSPGRWQKPAPHASRRPRPRGRAATGREARRRPGTARSEAGRDRPRSSAPPAPRRRSSATRAATRRSRDRPQTAASSLSNPFDFGPLSTTKVEAKSRAHKTVFR